MGIRQGDNRSYRRVTCLAMSTALRLWTTLRPLPAGGWIFTRLICLKAPYFASIRPIVLELREGSCTVRVRKRRRVLNHLGTVHAIAACNAVELAAGLGLDATLPPTHRWIPRGMTVEYRAKATTAITARATVTPPGGAGEGGRGWDGVDAVELPVPVEVKDASGVTVVSATVAMHVTRKPPR